MLGQDFAEDVADKACLVYCKEGCNLDIERKTLIREHKCRRISTLLPHPLLPTAERLPGTAIAYVRPQSTEMAAALAEKLGMRPEELEGQMEEMRGIVQKQSQELKDLMHKMHKESQCHQEAMVKKDEMLDRMLSDQRRAEEAYRLRQAELEKMNQEQNQERRKEREQAARLQEQVVEQMRQQHDSLQTDISSLRREKERSEEEHKKAITALQQKMSATSSPKKSDEGCMIQ